MLRALPKITKLCQLLSIYSQQHSMVASYIPQGVEQGYVGSGLREKDVNEYFKQTYGSLVSSRIALSRRSIHD